MGPVLSRYVGAPYCLGGRSIEVGFDCLSLLFAVFGDVGVYFPESFEDLTLGDYPELWRREPERAKGVMTRFVRSIGEEIPLCRSFIGDVMVASPRRAPDHTLVGVHAGQDVVLSAFTDIGVNLVNIQMLDVAFVVRVG